MAVMSRELRVQAGKQSAWETSVAPTVLLRGLEDFKIQLTPDVRMLDDMSLALAGSTQAVLARNTATASASGWASYEHLCYFLDSLLGEATPAGPTPYTYAYAAPLSTAPTVRMMTIVDSDSTVGGYNLTGAVCNSLTLTGEAGEPLTFSAEFIGWRSDADALESLTVPAVTPIMMSDVATIKWDTWAGTMGGTALDNCFVRSFELTMTANRTPRFCIGALVPSTYYENAWDGTLRMTLEFNATTKFDVTAIATSNLRQKQVEINFAVGATQALQLQFAGTVSNEPELFSDEDGVATVDLELSRTYHGTFANWFKASVEHGNATLA